MFKNAYKTAIIDALIVTLNALLGEVADGECDANPEDFRLAIYAAVGAIHCDDLDGAYRALNLATEPLVIGTGGEKTLLASSKAYSPLHLAMQAEKNHHEMARQAAFLDWQLTEEEAKIWG